MCASKREEGRCGRGGRRGGIEGGGEGREYNHYSAQSVGLGRSVSLYHTSSIPLGEKSRNSQIDSYSSNILRPYKS